MERTEQRKFTRIPFRTEVRISTEEGVLVSNLLRDISLGGAFVLVTPALNPGAACSVQLDLIGGASLLRITVEAEVLRVDPEGMALKFTNIDVDSLIHLKHFIKVHSADPNLVEEEFAHNLMQVE
jgi:hypothetical protein